MTAELDRTPVACPNGCIPTEPREFRWESGGVGTRNYCRECGDELKAAEDSIEVEA